MKRVLSVALFVAALCLCLWGAAHFFQRDDSLRKFGPFFEEKEDIDVFFMGTSRVLDAVSPMEIWRDTGITSYNMGNSSEPLGMTEQVLEISLDYHKPKVVLIDVYYIDRVLDLAWTYPYRHLFFDSVPLSMAKFDAVRATLPKSEWLEFMMPFSLYHGRWEEMLTGKEERMVDCEPYMMGGELRINRAVPDPYTRTTEMFMGDLPGFDPLRRMVKICRDNGIVPIFLAIPAPVSEEIQTYINSAQRIADELDVTFLNLFDVEGLVDFTTDCYDPIGHMNPDGASKVTAYLADYLTEHFELEDRRNDPRFDHWNDRLALYEKTREEQWGALTLAK